MDYNHYRPHSSYFYKERLEQIRGIYASPIAAAGRVYFVGRNGVAYVLKASEKLEVLAVNTLETDLKPPLPSWVMRCTSRARKTSTASQRGNSPS